MDQQELLTEVGKISDVGQKEGRICSHSRGLGNLVWRQPHLLELTYEELEERNLDIRRKRLDGVTSEVMKEDMLRMLKEEKGIKAVIVAFTDLEGKLHTLDYDKNFILDAIDNLTFDGSSIKGFSMQSESDLRLKMDWTSFRFVPADLFGVGKVVVFANVCDPDGNFYDGDFRAQLSAFCDEIKEKHGMTVNVAPEIEGFIFKGERAEQSFDEREGFELATMSGYFNSLPQGTLRLFIDKFAEVLRALGYQNEKDHPEVAPAQFEINFRYSLALDTADQILLYKLLARQVAAAMGMTASFLPKPIQELNGSGMHTNISLSKDGRNIFYGADDQRKLSRDAYKFLSGVLYHAKDLCLIMNPSVNAYRRLDPHYEAPNEIKMSSVDRGSMIRIPIGNEKSARIEVRTVAPDVNPYLLMFSLLKAGFKVWDASESEQMEMMGVMDKEVEQLPGEMYTAIEYFEKSEFMNEVMGEVNHKKYLNLKLAVANRAPRELGHRVKAEEILYHHEITNQSIWSDF